LGHLVAGDLYLNTALRDVSPDSSSFRDVTQRTLTVADVSGQPVGSIFKCQGVQDDLPTALHKNFTLSIACITQLSYALHIDVSGFDVCIIITCHHYHHVSSLSSRVIIITRHYHHASLSSRVIIIIVRDHYHRASSLSSHVIIIITRRHYHHASSLSSRVVIIITRHHYHHASSLSSRVI